jgi:hypothetical protein
MRLAMMFLNLVTSHKAISLSAIRIIRIARGSILIIRVLGIRIDRIVKLVVNLMMGLEAIVKK